MGPISKKASQSARMKICLVSMPWAIFNRPSIQLGTLKAFLERKADWLEVETKHPYLEVAAIMGTELYHWVSRNTWVSESLYAPLLFPEQKKAAEILALKYAGKADPDIRKIFNVKKLQEVLKSRLENWLENCDWSQYKIVGFSVCFNQLFASLAAAGLLKEHFPDLKIVLGGSSCAAAAGESLLESFRFIDFIIQGEGEESLLALCRYVSGRGNVLPENIFSAESPGPRPSGLQGPSAGSQISSLDLLSPPDFDDYFAEKNTWFSEKPFIPVLPVEFSRGCWWNKCAFCNLNLQWCGYRFKKASQMIHEVNTLSSRYGCLDFTFTDNMIPPQESLHFFAAMGKLTADFTFFAEIRVPPREKSIDEIFRLYRSGGLATIQVGIESLSSSLLKKMRKGTGVMENIATMRAAHEHSLTLEGNLIIQFPGSTQAEVDETLENLEYVLPFSPLTTAVFFLGHDSPVYAAPEKYGIMAIINHANNMKLIPKNVLKKLNLIVMDYRGDRIKQRKMWKPVVSRVVEWQQYHEKRNISARCRPLLSYRDGDDFLLIRQELINGEILHHRLRDFSRQIYLYCTQIRTDKELFEKFPTIPPQKILAFLSDLMKKRLVFSEKNRYIALAVRHRH